MKRRKAKVRVKVAVKLQGKLMAGVRVRPSAVQVDAPRFYQLGRVVD